MEGLKRVSGLPKPSVCGTPESPFGFGTLAPKKSHLLVQQADEHRAKNEGEHPKDKCKNRGNLKVLPGKREGNHPDCGDQRGHEQDREKKDAEENQKRLEVSKDRTSSHAETSIPPYRLIPSANVEGTTRWPQAEHEPDRGGNAANHPVGDKARRTDAVVATRADPGRDVGTKRILNSFPRWQTVSGPGMTRTSFVAAAKA